MGDCCGCYGGSSGSNLSCQSKMGEIFRLEDCFPISSFPRKRESRLYRIALCRRLDARLRGHDGLSLRQFSTSGLGSQGDSVTPKSYFRLSAGLRRLDALQSSRVMSGLSDKCLRPFHVNPASFRRVQHHGVSKGGEHPLCDILIGGGGKTPPAKWLCLSRSDL